MPLLTRFGDLGMPRAEARAWVNNEGPDCRGTGPGGRVFLLSDPEGLSPRYGLLLGGGAAAAGVGVGIAIAVVEVEVVADGVVVVVVASCRQWPFASGCASHGSADTDTGTDSVCA